MNSDYSLPLDLPSPTPIFGLLDESDLKTLEGME